MTRLLRSFATSALIALTGFGGAVTLAPATAQARSECPPGLVPTRQGCMPRDQVRRGDDRNRNDNGYRTNRDNRQGSQYGTPQPGLQQPYHAPGVPRDSQSAERERARQMELAREQRQREALQREQRARERAQLERDQRDRERWEREQRERDRARWEREQRERDRERWEREQHQDRRFYVRVGDRIRGMNYQLIRNPGRYGLRPAKNGTFYAILGKQVLRVDRSSMRVLQIVGRLR